MVCSPPVRFFIENPLCYIYLSTGQTNCYIFGLFTILSPYGKIKYAQRGFSDAQVQASAAVTAGAVLSQLFNSFYTSKKKETDSCWAGFAICSPKTLLATISCQTSDQIRPSDHHIQTNFTDIELELTFCHDADGYLGFPPGPGCNVFMLWDC